MIKSKLGKLELIDFIKGLIIAIITSVLTVVMQMLTNVPPTIDYKQIATVSILATCGYILKQIGTNNKGEFLTKDK